MKIYSPFTFIIFFLLIGCNKTSVSIQTVELPTLRASDIYDSFKLFEFKPTDKNKEIAEQYFQKGKDTLSTDLKAAIYYFKRSITLFPQEKSYLELGKIFLKSGNYEFNALLNFMFFKTYNYDNKYNTDTIYFTNPSIEFYKLAVEFEIINKNFISLEFDNYVYSCQEKGYTIENIKNWIETSEILSETQKKESIANLIFLKSEKELEEYKTSNINFKNYVSFFKSASSSFSINEKNVFNFDYKDIDDYLISAFLYEKIKENNTYMRINYLYKCFENDSVIGVVYSFDKSDPAIQPKFRNIFYRLVTYSQNGNLIENLIIAYQADNELATCQYDKGIIKVNLYDRIWKQQFDNQNIDNEIKEINLIETIDYKIETNGKITKTSKTETLSDTTSQTSNF